MSLDATVSGPAANSYLTIDAATVLFEGYEHETEWDDLGETDQARALIQGTRAIDQYTAWSERKVSDQALAFPRAADESGVIPEEVKRALMAFVDFRLDPDAVSLKDLQAEGVTAASILGQNMSFAADRSSLPAESRRELDKLVAASWGVGRENHSRARIRLPAEGF